MTTVNKKRHLAKTITYRLLSSTISSLLLWTFTNSWQLGALFSITEMVIKPLIYYIHERVWYKWIRFGVIKKDKNDT